ncbi:RpiB/LacA/LacB family sugar-phosphate isomerase [Photobacterium sp. ZSDE20]|uniref:RpiB/LacA/LacB family sugar-phosphate isomerase n=1 Tax=Photobacterium pectinilyticum TaxID=2906793 RepID=A0ABT1N624_9GAMM|nr:RpiB/LacA/LacB family sugar-phosphate isomerase [Photobacterium sp. ZSDE20]MCQ1060193.1 RpiB/LacA/LacB family sugar-phosphate isomerase [Photobacterium sp. ZSDE20]MDD1827646.1 RpiB/LacA/LacB family sugar-phosphate isomerase [Photobacterium sp. ZSDE20]
MKIALIMENSQASKNAMVLSELNTVASPLGHEVANLGMCDESDHHLTYVHLGVMASILINSKAADFIFTGCGTGQGAMMSCNMHPGVVCGYCVEPSDAFLFNQINNGNALSLIFAKGFGWAGELNVRYIFEKALTGERGQGYPLERAKPQKENASALYSVKTAVAKDVIDGLKSIDQDIVKTAIGGVRFQEYFFAHCQDKKIANYVRSLLTS